MKKQSRFLIDLETAAEYVNLVFRMVRRVCNTVDRLPMRMTNAAVCAVCVTPVLNRNVCKVVIGLAVLVQYSAVKESNRNIVY